MNPLHIDDEEVLYRAIVGPQRDLLSQGSPDAALFIDGRGLSVDRDGGRCDSEVLRSFSDRFRRQGCDVAVKISAGKCRSAGAYPVATGNKKNKYHAEIHDSKQKVRLSLLKAMKIANLCEIVKSSR